MCRVSSFQFVLGVDEGDSMEWLWLARDIPASDEGETTNQPLKLSSVKFSLQ